MVAPSKALGTTLHSAPETEREGEKGKGRESQLIIMYKALNMLWLNEVFKKQREQDKCGKRKRK